MNASLEDFTVAIGDLLAPAAGRGLNRKRAAEMDVRLRDLDRARRQAWTELRWS